MQNTATDEECLQHGYDINGYHTAERKIIDFKDKLIEVI